MTRAAARTNTVNSSGGGGGGTVNDGVLQIAGGVPLSASLQGVQDQLGNDLPIRVSTTELRFDVNVGIGVDPSSSYGLYITSSGGTVLANRYHFTSDRYLDASGVTFPTATNYTFAMGGVNQLVVNSSGVTANNSIGFGVAGTPPSIGSYLTSGYSSNGEYMRLYSGHNPQYAYGNYQFNVPSRTFNATLLDANRVASIIDIPNHTFSITNAAATAVNYRGISLAYTINNTVTATGLASGIRIDANITNLNGMINRAFYYGVTGIASNTINRGIELVNTDAATSGNQRLSPSVILQGSGWRTNATAASQTVAYEIYVSPQQFGASPLPQLNFDTIINGVRNTIFSIGGSSGLSYSPSVAGTNAVLTFGNSNITGNSNQLNASVRGDFAVSAFNLINTTSNFVNTSGDRYGFNSSVAFTPASGTGTFSFFAVTGAIHQTGGANGVVRGYWFNPAVTGSPSDLRAIDIEQGRIFFKNLRTTAGAAGELWNDGGTIKIS